MKSLGMLDRNLELNPERRPIWAWLKLYLTLKKYHLNQNRLDYQLLFRKGAFTKRPNSRDGWKKSRNKSIMIVIKGGQ